VTGFDHLVLRCADVETTLAWYVDVLGLAPVRVDRWRAGEVPFPSVRVNDDTIIDLLAAGRPGQGTGGADAVIDVGDGRLDHLCLVVEPIDLEVLAAREDLDVTEGPVTRFGARGDGRSVYLRDPDGATVELRYYPGA
jgi:catechol 2,3-dioxygenase-like lactoylglutathione lyase family enzyme